MTLKVRILQFLTTFTQLTARLKNFLMDWLLVLGLEKGLVECATLCVKSWVILVSKYVDSYEEVMNAQKLGINVNELKKVPGLLSLFERSHISPDGMVLPRDPISKLPT